MTKYNRGLLVVLIASMCLNVFFVSYAVTILSALSDPQTAVREQIQKRIDRLPDQYKAHASEQLAAFYDKNLPAINALRDERKAFMTMLMGDFNPTQAQDEAAKIRAMSQKAQETGQMALIDLLKGIPAAEKAKMIEGDRLMHALMKEDAK